MTIQVSPRARRYLGHAERSLLIAGALLSGCWAGVWLEGRVYQAYQNRQLNHLLATGPASANLSAGRSARPSNGVLGRLEIPRVGLSVLVLNGVDAATLILGAGRLPGTSRTGNLVIAGHRDTFFRPLRDIRKDDRIQVTTIDGVYPYVVEWTAVVDPSDTGVLANTTGPSLTLITCYPFRYIGPAPKRFVVRARLASAGTSAPAPAELAREARPSPFLAPHRLPDLAGDAEAPAPGTDENAAVSAAVQPPGPPAAARATHGIARLNPVHLFKRLARTVRRSGSENVADRDQP